MNDKCTFNDCKEQRVAFSECCWEHTEKKDGYINTLSSKIKTGISLKGANLSKVVLRNLDLSRSDFSGAILSRADLSGSSLFDTNLKGAELLGANLSGSDLTSASLEGADLTKSNLFGARLWHADLKSANLIEANLSSTDLWGTRLFDVRLWHTNLTNVSSLSRENFTHRKNRYTTHCRINEQGILSSEDGYRSLKRHFLARGRYNEASWASYKEKNQEKALLKKNRNPAYLPSLIMNILCGYGEKPNRIIMSSFFVVVGYATIYKILGAIRAADTPAYILSMGDYIYYSVITFTTVGYGDFIPKAAPLFRLLAASEAFIGTFMIGLFIFTLARKYAAR
ncbi:MAG: pentapeptide repeat-containing protein [Candidatus Omnitrophica bacterium]|nr:pentapeptide repeat-containing protein [Candidatus Omnitrophota bacterium]